MQITNLTQPDPGVQAPVATATAVSGNSEQLRMPQLLLQTPCLLH